MADLSSMPRVDAVLADPALTESEFERWLVRAAVTEVLDGARTAARNGAEVPTVAEAAARTASLLDAWTDVRPRAVINATGVLLHTNLGRAPLGASAIDAMAAAAGTCDLEISLEDGRRGSRFTAIRPLLSRVCGAQDVHVVNNGAAALLLACTALVGDGAVALSRGQMIEIGDGFRVATMAAAAGAPMIEVGSTNRTHLEDYAAAIDAGATVLLWAHLSNFALDGFVQHVSLADLADLARRRGVRLVADLGSGSLGRGVPGDEPTLQAYVSDGPDLVTCSGDKLFGGPQVGVMAGRAEVIERCRRHPMARALRPDKTTMAALHATVVEHVRSGEIALPLHTMLRATEEQLRARAVALCEELGWSTERVRSVASTIGGGSLPGDTMRSVAVSVPVERPSAMARRLRLGAPPLVGRIHEGELLLDLRTVPPRLDGSVAGALRAALDSAHVE